MNSKKFEGETLETRNVNNRQYNLDLIKAVAITCMMFCHPAIRLGEYRSGYVHEFPYFFGDEIIGDYLVAAHGFMFAMGVGMVYSRKGTPSDLIRRGIKLWFLGYVLNFLRYGIFVLGYDIISGEFLDETMDALFTPDILHFAGLALIATGLFKKLKLQEIHIFAIGLALSAIGTAVGDFDTGNFVMNLILGNFIYTTEDASVFCFFNWYIFVAAGLLFGKILQAAPDKNALYKKLLFVSGFVTIAYVVSSFAFGSFFLSKNHDYYIASPLEAAGLLSIDFFLLSVFYFLLKKVNVSKFRVPIEMSKNITTIYFIHWIILGSFEIVFCYLLGLVFNYPVIYMIGAILLVVSFYLARLYHTLKKRRKKRRASIIEGKHMK